MPNLSDLAQFEKKILIFFSFLTINQSSFPDKFYPSKKNPRNYNPMHIDIFFKIFTPASPIPPGRGRMVPSCYTKNSRRGGLSLAAAIQRGEALRKETLLEQLFGIHPGNQFATASHYHGPRFQYKEQSNYSTAQGLAYRQLIPHTCVYEFWPDFF